MHVNAFHGNTIIVLNNEEESFLSAMLLTEILDQPLGSSLPDAYIQGIPILYAHYALFTCTIEQGMQVTLEQLYTGSDIQETTVQLWVGKGIN